VLRPDSAAGAGSTTRVDGVMLDVHGGGFIYGSAAMADGINSHYARALNIAIVGVNYRLAPANPHPAAFDDCVRAALWLIDKSQQEFGTTRLLISGESAGATLAALTLLALRDQHDRASRFCGAQLLVGNFDLSMTPSQRSTTDRIFLNAERLEQSRARAFPGRSLEELRNPSISPLYAGLHDLVPAIFTSGTGDALLDDSLFMAARWEMAGNVTELQVYPEAPHLFMDLPTAMAAEGRRRAVKFLGRCLAGEFAQP
jgi:acetyl esterase/lipase